MLANRITLCYEALPLFRARSEEQLGYGQPPGGPIGVYFAPSVRAHQGNWLAVGLAMSSRGDGSLRGNCRDDQRS